MDYVVLRQMTIGIQIQQIAHLLRNMHLQVGPKSLYNYVYA